MEIAISYSITPAVTPVCFSTSPPLFLNQPIGVLAIDGAALALPVRTERAANIGTLVPAQTQPMQRVENGLLGGSGRAHLIGILDAQNKLAALTARETEIE